MGGRSFAGSPVLLFFPRSDNQRLRASLSGSERKQAVEKALIDHLGLGYLHAHQIATRAEQAAVRASGVTWQAYDRFMREFVKRIGDETLSRVPRDLDLKPYKDEHDDGLLRRMAASLEQGRMPLGFRAYRVHDRRKRG